VAESARIDKWLWAVRIFKTRSLATDFCKSGKVIINDHAAKPSRNVAIGDIVHVKKPPVAYQYRVKGIIEKRVSAKIAIEMVEDITPPEELEKLQLIRESAFFARSRGTGRPTKKERRDLDKLKR